MKDRQDQWVMADDLTVMYTHTHAHIHTTAREQVYNISSIIITCINYLKAHSTTAFDWSEYRLLEFNMLQGLNKVAAWGIIIKIIIIIIIIITTCNASLS